MIRLGLRSLSATLVVAALCIQAATTSAQVTTITPSGGAKNLNTTITQNGNTVDITGGTRSGTNTRNLFHSFGLFSIGPNDVANFKNDSNTPTSNIIGRVTDGVRSEIYGTIQTSGFGQANLFLLNPAGWVFGAGASLNVGGAFHATTAHYLDFGKDGNGSPIGVFCANDCTSLNRPQILSSQDPVAFGFLRRAEPIEVRGAFFGPPGVPEGGTLSLVGGNLTIADFSSLLVPGGQIQLGSFASAGEAAVSGLDGSFSALGSMRLENSSIAATGTASLGADGKVVGLDGGSILVRGGQIEIAGTTIDVSGGLTVDANSLPVGTRSGTVVIRGGQLSVTDFSTINAISISSDPAPSIAIGLEATGNIRLSGSELRSETAGAGDGGDIRIVGGSIDMDGGATIRSFTDSTGRGGAVALEAETVTLSDGAAIRSTSVGLFGAGGTGGAITLTGRGPAGSITVTGLGTGIFSEATSAATTTNPGGAVTLSAPSISIRDGGLVSTVTTSLLQPAGDIVMNAQNFTLSGGGSIQGVTFGGPGGDITVNAAGSVRIAGDGSGIISGASAGGLVDSPAGNITIDAHDVTVTDLGIIRNGNVLDIAGNIAVRATDAITISNGGQVVSQAFAENVGDISLSARTLTLDNGLIQTATRQSGNAGNVFVNVGEFLLVGGGRIVSSTEASGKGGQVRITADTATISGQQTGIFSTGELLSTGDAGKITVTAETLNLTHGAQLSVATAGTGAGGDIELTANRIRLEDGATITARNTTSVLGPDSSAGNINITFGDSLVLERATMSTESLQAPGGNITIASTGSLLYLFNGQILTSVQTGVGSGGDITIGTSAHPLSFLVLNNGGIHANAFGGAGGNINIFANSFFTNVPIETAVTASSALSAPGTINISATITDVSGSLAELPSGLFTAAALLRASCAARLAEGRASSLVVAGREGVPVEPDGLLPSRFAGVGTPRTAGAVQASVASKLSEPLPTLRLAYFDEKCRK